MSVKKTYVLKHYQRMMKHVMVGSKRVLTEFVSTGINPNYKGTFTTANPEIIAALEASVDFNREYEVKSIEEVKEPVKELVQYRSNPEEVKKFREEQEKDRLLAEEELAAKYAEKEPAAPEPVIVVITKDEVKEVEKEPEGDVKVIPVSEVANFQSARKYLKGNYPDLSAKQILNKADVIATAIDKGIKFEAIQS